MLSFLSNQGGSVKVFISLFVLATLIGCATNNIDYRMPASRFQTPEVTGGALFQMDLQARANLNYGSSNRVATSNILQDTLQDEDEELLIRSSSQIGLKLDFSVLDRLDMYWTIVWGSPAVGGFKWQFLGETEREYSKGWKGSVALGWGSSKSDPAIFNFLNSDDEYLSSSEMSVYDLSLQFGYRFNPRLLLYLNGFYNPYKTDVKLEAPDDASYDDIEQTLETDSYGVLIGIQYYFVSKRSFVNLELGGSQGTIENMDEESKIATLGLNFGWIFN